jgi:leucyl-tRNA synthetase
MQLPVLLPEVENYQPSGTGESPLATIPEFYRTLCPVCHGPARRETDTMGGYACSSWYFLRFADPKNDSAFASRPVLDYWLPVDIYAGGIEHARSHLLYARFWTKVLYDEGLVGFDEPFLTLRNQGSLLAMTPGRRPSTANEISGGEAEGKIIDWIVLKPEEREAFPKEQVIWRWARMSKSKGNVVTPDEISDRYGADSLRVYEMFVAPFEDDVHWTEEGIQGSYRFVSRVWRWLHAALPLFQKEWRKNIPGEISPAERPVRRKLHQTIRKVSSDIEGFQFNTAIAALMELLNDIYAYAPVEKEVLPRDANPQLVSELVENLTLLIAPFTPHLGEEVWQEMGHRSLVYRASWPNFDAAVAAEDEINIMVQINGKIRDKVQVRSDTDEESVRRLIFQSARVMQFISGKEVIKTVFVPNKMFSIVIK